MHIKLYPLHKGNKMKKKVPTELLDQVSLREFVISLDQKHFMIPPYREAVELIRRETNRDAIPWRDIGLQATPPFFVKFSGTHDDFINIKCALKQKGFKILGYYIYMRFSAIIKVRTAIELDTLVTQIKRSCLNACHEFP